jgi:hypothetical protein
MWLIQYISNKKTLQDKGMKHLPHIFLRIEFFFLLHRFFLLKTMCFLYYSKCVERAYDLQLFNAMQFAHITEGLSGITARGGRICCSAHKAYQ